MSSVDKIDLSLDDIIKINRKQTKQKKVVKTQGKLKQFRTNLGNKKNVKTKLGTGTSPLNRQNLNRQSTQLSNKRKTQNQNQRGKQQRIQGQTQRFQGQTQTRRLQTQALQTKRFQANNQRLQRTQRQHQQTLNRQGQKFQGQRQQQAVQRSKVGKRQFNQGNSNVVRQQQQHIIPTRRINNQRAQKAARANLVNAKRGIQTTVINRQKTVPKQRQNRNISSSQVYIQQTQQAQPQTARPQRTRRWNRTHKLKDDGLITINVQNNLAASLQRSPESEWRPTIVRQNQLQEEIRNMKPTKKQTFDFQRDDFSKGQTRVSLSERFAGNSQPIIDRREDGVRQVYA